MMGIFLYSMILMILSLKLREWVRGVGKANVNECKTRQSSLPASFQPIDLQHEQSAYPFSSHLTLPRMGAWIIRCLLR